MAMPIVHLLRDWKNTFALEQIKYFVETERKPVNIILIQDGVQAPPFEDFEIAKNPWVTVIVCREDIEARGVNTAYSIVAHDEIAMRLRNAERVYIW